MSDQASEVCRSNRWGVYLITKSQIYVITEISLTCEICHVSYFDYFTELYVFFLFMISETRLWLASD